MRTQTPAAHHTPQVNGGDPSSDLLVGAKAIADYLNLSLRQVYAMREAEHPALTKEPGLGLCARKSRLDAVGTGAVAQSLRLA